MHIERRVGLWILAAAPIVLGALGTVAFFGQQYLSHQPRRLSELILLQSGWLIYAALAPGVFVVSKRWPFSAAAFGRRAALHLGFALLYWAIVGAILSGLVPELLPGEGTSHAASWSAFAAIASRVLRWIVATLPYGALVYFAIVGVEHAIRYFGEARERDLQMSRLEGQLARARLAALQSQVNPHFLFNALNTIAVRARQGDGVGTARIAEQLAEILRRTLSRDQAHEIPLADELELVQQYLAIEQARFADRLSADFDVDDSALGGAVPTLSVQHLAENAVRHGIARSAEAGRVMIAARRDGAVLEVRVADDGPGVMPGSEARPEETGGIANTRERLRSLYGPAASLELTTNEPRGTVATLRIPYREVTLELSDARQ